MSRRRRRILCVEDEPELLEDLASELRACGYEVAEASDGMQAFAMIVDGGVDLVVSDVHLPRLNGLELRERVEQACGTIPFILLSAHIGLTFGGIKFSVGDQELMLKPVDYRQLALRVERIFVE